MGNKKGFTDVKTVSVLAGLAVIIACVSAWFTHVFVCLADEAWGFLIAGAVFFPIAIIHGVGVWFGVF